MVNLRTWADRLDYFFAALGFAVGLTNVWRFPYLCYQHGGGAFLIPYILSNIFIACPLMYMEVCLAQFRGRNVFKLYDLCPVLRGQAISQIFTSTAITYYYNIILGYACMFCIEGLFTVPPWETCDNYYNKRNCFPIGTDTFGRNSNDSSSFEYMTYRVLMRDPQSTSIGKIGGFLFGMVCFVWFLNICLLSYGAKTIGKTAYFLVLFPYISLTAMCIQVFQMPGSSNGVKFYITPRMENLLDPIAWKDATSQIFFSLGISHASVLTLSSFNVFHKSNALLVASVCFLNALSSIFAGFLVFGTVGFLAHSLGQPVSKVVTKGPDLTFRLYPEVLKLMPVSKLWSFLFFFSVLALGVGSLGGLTEPVMLSTSELCRHLKLVKTNTQEVIYRALLCTTFALLSLPLCCENSIEIWQQIDSALMGTPVLIYAFHTPMMICWVYGFDKFKEDVEFMTQKKLHIFWKYTWCYICPLAIFGLIVGENTQPMILSEKYPFVKPVYYCFRLFPILIIYVYGICYVIKNGGFCAIRESVKPLPSWGPHLDEDRANYNMIIGRSYTEKEENKRLFSNKENIMACIEKHMHTATDPNVFRL